MAKRKPAAKQSGNGRPGRVGRKPGAATASGRAGKGAARSPSSGKAAAGKSAAAKPAAAKPAASKAAGRRPAEEKKPVARKVQTNHRPVTSPAPTSNPRVGTAPAPGVDGRRPAAPVAVGDLSGDELRQTNLTAAELAEFRELLLEKRRELVGDVANLSDEARRAGAPGGTVSSMPIHMADLGSDTWEQELTLGLIENERGLLREIDEALDRIEKKTYGICIATNKPIGKARLRLKPWAKYGIEYARKRELGLA